MAIRDMDMGIPDMITATAAMATPIPGLTIDAIIGPIATTIMSGARIAVIIAGGTERPAPAQGRAPAKTASWIDRQCPGVARHAPEPAHALSTATG